MSIYRTPPMLPHVHLYWRGVSIFLTVVEKPEGRKQPEEIEAGQKFGVSSFTLFSGVLNVYW